jgi:hypothetical protein
MRSLGIDSKTVIFNTLVKISAIIARNILRALLNGGE